MQKALLIKGFSAGVGAAIAIGALALLQMTGPELVMLMAPFGATAVLLFVVPESPLAQARNVILGHFITALTGLIFFHWIGVNEISLALATGIGIFMMVATNSTHPPAGANPLLIMMTGQHWWFLLDPVLVGAVAMVIIAKGYHLLIQRVKSQ